MDGWMGTGWVDVHTSSDLMKRSVSFFPKLWDLPVYYLNHPAERILTLGCPGAQANMAVAWDSGSEPIYRSEHLAGEGATSPRVYLDAGHHLVFNPAAVQDSGRKCCKLNLSERLAATPNTLIKTSSSIRFYVLLGSIRALCSTVVSFSEGSIICCSL